MHNELGIGCLHCLGRINNTLWYFKKGLFDPELAYFLQWADPTGEKAVRNVLAQQAEKAVA